MCRWSGAPITEQQRDCSSWPLGAVLQPLADAIPVSLWSWRARLVLLQQLEVPCCHH